MNSGCAMNEQPRSRLLQRLIGEFHPPLEHRCRLGLEIVLDRIPQHLNPIGLRKFRVVELNLHIDDMRDSGPRDRCHVLCVPDPAPDRDPVGHPCHVHACVPHSPEDAGFPEYAGPLHSTELLLTGSAAAASSSFAGSERFIRSSTSLANPGSSSLVSPSAATGDKPIISNRYFIVERSPRSASPVA